MTKTIAPIFIAKTRSFWLGIVPASLTLIDVAFQALTAEGSEPVANALALILSAFGADLTGEQIAGVMRALAPLYALIVAQQRSGLARPYTASLGVEKAVVAAVEDGKSAFEAGKAIGASIKRAGG